MARETEPGGFLKLTTTKFVPPNQQALSSVKYTVSRDKIESNMGRHPTLTYDLHMHMLMCKYPHQHVHITQRQTERHRYQREGREGGMEEQRNKEMKEGRKEGSETKMLLKHLSALLSRSQVMVPTVC